MSTPSPPMPPFNEANTLSPCFASLIAPLEGLPPRIEEQPGYHLNSPNEHWVLDVTGLFLEALREKDLQDNAGIPICPRINPHAFRL